MSNQKRYIRVGKEKIVVDIDTYRAFNRIRNAQYKQNNLYDTYTVPLSEIQSTDATVVEDEAEHNLLIEQLHKALESLTGEEYLLIHELFYCGKSQQQVADILGKSAMTVSRRKKKILQKLKMLMKF